MKSPVITAREDATVAEVAKTMLDNRIGSVVIVGEDGTFLGMVTEGEFLPYEEGFPFLRGTVSRIMGVNAGTGDHILYAEAIAQVCDKPIGNVMKRDAPTAELSTPVNEIAKMMSAHHSQHIPVLQDGKPVGIVARHDILRIFIK